MLRDCVLYYRRVKDSGNRVSIGESVGGRHGAPTMGGYRCGQACQANWTPLWRNVSAVIKLWGLRLHKWFSGISRIANGRYIMQFIQKRMAVFIYCLRVRTTPISARWHAGRSSQNIFNLHDDDVSTSPSPGPLAGIRYHLALLIK